MSCFTRAKAVTAIIIGAMLCCIGGLLYTNLPLILKKTIFEKLIPTPDGGSSTPDIAIYSKIYLFNYTNHEEFLKGALNGTKPKVKQLGPYVYRVYSTPGDRRFDENDTIIQTTSSRYYIYEPGMSTGKEDDKIIFPNVPLRAFLQGIPVEAADGALMMLDPPQFGIDPFISTTVEQLLFKGYVCDIFETLSSFGLEGLPPDSKFGFFNTANNSNGTSSWSYTGKGNIQLKGKVKYVAPYYNDSTIEVWKGTKCEAITGNEPGNFHPEITKDDVLNLFLEPACRHLRFRYKKEVLHHGALLYRFEADASELGDGNVNPDNSCFCELEGDECAPTGLYSVKKCKGGKAPVAISWPHFYMAEQRIKDSIEGLHPEPDKHNSHFDILPLVGAPLMAKIQVQTNLEVKRIPHLPPSVDCLPEIYLPLFWSQEGADLDKKTVEGITGMLNSALLLGNLAPIGILILGGFIGTLGILCSIIVNFKVVKDDRKNVVHIKKQAWVTPQY
ncbi:scavenger receptor class B, member [Chamberlinius hualienensis]